MDLGSRRTQFPLRLLIGFLAVAVWSVIRPYDYLTWSAEAAPALIIVILLVATFRKFRLTSLLYGLLFISLVIMLIGSHYTYERVPLFDAMRTWFHLKRNHFDRFGHLFQGAVTALAASELLLRCGVVSRGKWLAGIAISSALAVSGLYEIAEFLSFRIFGGDVDLFLGHQGDEWDAQWDMLSGLTGAAIGMAGLRRPHSKQIAKLGGAPGELGR
ncbi:DUF2238 domain-containing protein [Paenibacillus sp. GCM10023250]|uniref:DUF2238 domain-containing protein n=1 Tax=Paenibacillus sp. GCM10023250 TaxID=3252648 RepID=UPI00361366B8